MDSLYVIYENDSDYEGYPEPIGYALTEDKAKEMCDKLNGYLEVLKKVKEDLKELLAPHYGLDFESSIEVPRWAAGLSATEITAEQRAERDEIMAKNELISARNKEKTKAAYDKRAEITTQTIDGLDCTDELREFIRTRIDWTHTFHCYDYEKLDNKYA